MNHKFNSDVGLVDRLFKGTYGIKVHCNTIRYYLNRNDIVSAIDIILNLASHWKSRMPKRFQRIPIGPYSLAHLQVKVRFAFLNIKSMSKEV